MIVNTDFFFTFSYIFFVQYKETKKRKVNNLSFQNKSMKPVIEQFNPEGVFNVPVILLG